MLRILQLLSISDDLLLNRLLSKDVARRDILNISRASGLVVVQRTMMIQNRCIELVERPYFNSSLTILLPNCKQCSGLNYRTSPS